ncbi:uncharacterized protein LOC134477489 [Cavia porcellus]|uniref:uncharacterized protein LOC134477489 n=1 Tax=Cavia porcellus TaxID=10141 RepID=UPI002FE152B1
MGRPLELEPSRLSSGDFSGARWHLSAALPSPTTGRGPCAPHRARRPQVDPAGPPGSTPKSGAWRLGPRFLTLLVSPGPRWSSCKASPGPQDAAAVPALRPPSPRLELLRLPGARRQRRVVTPSERRPRSSRSRAQESLEPARASPSRPRSAQPAAAGTALGSPRLPARRSPPARPPATAFGPRRPESTPGSSPLRTMRARPRAEPGEAEAEAAPAAGLRAERAGPGRARGTAQPSPPLARPRRPSRCRAPRSAALPQLRSARSRPARSSSRRAAAAACKSVSDMEMNDSLPDANLHQTDTGVTTQPILPSTARDVSGTGTRPPEPPLRTPPLSPLPLSPHPPSPPPTPGPGRFPVAEPLECLPLLEAALRCRARASLLLAGRPNCARGGAWKPEAAADAERRGDPGTRAHPTQGKSSLANTAAEFQAVRSANLPGAGGSWQQKRQHRSGHYTLLLRQR